MKALVHAEERLGRPAYLIEIKQSWARISKEECGQHALFIAIIIYDLYQNDEVLANQNMEQFTVNAEFQGEHYQTYSDRRENKFLKYSITGPNLSLVAN